jgi:hypothetical protein
VRRLVVCCDGTWETPTERTFVGVWHTVGDEGSVVTVGVDGTAELEIGRPGYLYAYANDSWLGYGGNRGAATLTVTRA